MLKGKVALITGASSGLGSAIAKQYAKEGAHVILLGKNLKKLEDTDDIIKVFNGESTIISLDLTDFEKIPSLSSSILNKFQKLDVLVSNASTMQDLGLLADCTEEDWHNVFNLNLHSNWFLIKHLDPLLKLSKAGRAIFVTSSFTQLHNQSFWGAYTITKSALEYMVKMYAAEVAHTNVKANLVSPGPFNSSIYQKAFPGKDLSLERQPHEILEIFVKLASEQCRFSGKIHDAQQ